MAQVDSIGCLREEQVTFVRARASAPGNTPNGIHTASSGPSLISWMSRWYLGRYIPSLFILETNVVRLRPSRAAAPCGPPIIPLAARNVCKIRVASYSCSDPCGATVGIVFVCDGGRGLGSTPSSDRITDRSIRFWSSRTLPGQGYAMNAFIVVSGICSMCFPIRRAKTSAK